MEGHTSRTSEKVELEMSVLIEVHGHYRIGFALYGEQIGVLNAWQQEVNPSL